MLGLTHNEYEMLSNIISPPATPREVTREEEVSFRRLLYTGRVEMGDTCRCGRHVFARVTPLGLEAKRIHEAILVMMSQRAA